MTQNYYDAAVQRLQNLQLFHLERLEEGRPVPGHDVHPSAIAPLLVINTYSVPEDISTVAIVQMEWGQHVATAQRVWEIHERMLRAWKAKRTLELKDAKGEDGKPLKLSQAAIEATYRLEPDYARYNEAVERAAEAHQRAQAVLDAVKAKVQMLRQFAQNLKDSQG